VANSPDGGYYQFETVWKEYGWNSCYEEPSGVLNWVVPPNIENIQVGYIRVTGYTNADGSKMIVTVNEPIT
jgi:hypothetical protein